MWGFTDKYSWIPNWSDGEQGAATPYDQNIEPKPAYWAIHQALGGSGGPPDDGDDTEPPEPPGSGECVVDYTVANQWPSGFTARLRVTNNGAALDGWTLEFDFTAGQQVTNGWKANWSQSGNHVTATSKAWNAEMGTGDSVTLGFNGSYSGSNPEPVSFTLDGVACTTS